MSSDVKYDATLDHKVIEGAQATRRYFAKFERIIGHLKQVADLSHAQGEIDAAEADVLSEYLEGLSHTFTALSYKFLLSNRVGDHAKTVLSIDKSDSGFPIFQEVLQMASDAMQAKENLHALPDQDSLKKQMVSHILNERSSPIQLQYALSQRMYFEYLTDANLFLSQNHPKGIWTGARDGRGRRSYLIHWAVYDSQSNLPVIYFMDVEDTGKKALPRDERRWPRVKSHVMAQSMSSLNLLTIARGFDRDFNDLHPKKLRRFHLGPMYSHAFTQQRGDLRDVLAEASGEPGLDWTLTWMTETLISEKTTEEKTGMFGKAEREIYKVDTLNPSAIENGATDVIRALIMPHRAYQVLEEKDPRSLRKTRKYVVGKNSRILSYK